MTLENSRSRLGMLFGAAVLGATLSACASNGASSLPASRPAVAPAPVSQSGTVPLAVAKSDATAATAAAATVRYHLYPIVSKRTSAALRAQSVNYPADLAYYGGAVVRNTTSHDVYINCTATCFGDPQEFVDNLNASPMIHIVDQYVGSSAKNRYGFGGNALAHQTLYTNLISQNNLLAIVHSAALRFGSGYGNVYHVFLPQGADTCFDGTNICYSPDNPPNWVFCAYHGSVDFGDRAGHVLFTILPYQNVPGCQITGGPNGPLVDSTDSTLSHEYFETLTDPDPNSAWFNPVYRGEIADLCQAFGDVDTLGGHRYAIQEEYSNKLHACTNEP